MVGKSSISRKKPAKKSPRKDIARSSKGKHKYRKGSHVKKA